jgi:hypothetical protein
MSGVTRRAVLAGVATAGVAATLALKAGGAQQPALAIYDSRLAEARAFAASARARGIPLHDIAREDDDLWRSLRSVAGRNFAGAPGRAVIGMTGWTGFVSVRGLFEAQGLRVRHEAKIRSSRRATPTIFEWRMA